MAASVYKKLTAYGPKIKHNKIKVWTEILINSLNKTNYNVDLFTI